MTTLTNQLPCDTNGICMLCNSTPANHDTLTCKTCATPWHVSCILTRPSSVSDAAQWECPDCTPSIDATETVSVSFSFASMNDSVGGLVGAIRAIEADPTLSDVDKAKRRQELMSGKVGTSLCDVASGKDDNEILGILGENIECSFCMQLPDRPVTTPCGHNFCLRCFEKWVGQGKRTCAKCRKSIPSSMVSHPHINSSLVYAIRTARMQKPSAVEGPRVFQFIHNDDLPDEAFTTERAKKAGKANARSGKIFVTIPNDHLGPITADYDPVRKTGVLVGDSWTDRLACRQWGAHFPHISGIAGQEKHGAQSVVLSGGYEDDEDHGEWFFYTGSGGRDLSGNRRTNKHQSSDQKFTATNAALRLSCRKGYPVRVVRSAKDVRSSYAPEKGVRYDGIYRIERCWIKLGVQKNEDGKRFKVCRYLFVRCDNSPAPWTSDEHGDRPRPLPDVGELKEATELTERKERAHWDFDEAEGCWKWVKPPPPSKLIKGGEGSSRMKKSSKAKILKEFSCCLCQKVLSLPITTPCAHNFCKACLDSVFEGQNFLRERKIGGRQLRTRKSIMQCPSCPMDLADFLQNAQVNRELMGVIESLMSKFEEEDKAEEACQEESCNTLEKDMDEDNNVVEHKDKDTSREGEEKNVSDPMETENKPAASTSNVDRKRKNTTVITATLDCESSKSRKEAEDGNDSPSSPLHVNLGNELK